MDAALFDYHLPEKLIAQVPLSNREASRVLVLDRERNITQELQSFSEIAQFFQPDDLLVVNNSRVIPARLHGQRKNTGGKVEILLIRETADYVWKALVKPARRIRCGEIMVFGDGRLVAEVVKEGTAGERTLSLSYNGKLENILLDLGHIPLPPYIKEPLHDGERYQTMFACKPGSVAAPTAGLHFTPSLLDSLISSGVRVAEVTLHVGTGTFRPIIQDDAKGVKTLDAEYLEIPTQTADAINDTRNKGGRVTAVGTTVVRTLESRGQPDGTVQPGSGWTKLFIYPPFTFNIVDRLITNFHLPRSTLLMLVCAFAGRSQVLSVYQQAVDMRFRFYSFGDAMLII